MPRRPTASRAGSAPVRRRRRKWSASGRDIARPVAERAQIDARDIQPIEQVLAEAAEPHGLFQIDVLVAAITRTSMAMGSRAPTRTTSRSCNTRSNLTCRARARSPIRRERSCRYSPPRTSRPWRRSHPVNAPFSCPNNSASTSVSTKAPQLTATKRTIAPRACLMDETCDQFLAGSGLARRSGYSRCWAQCARDAPGALRVGSSKTSAEARIVGRCRSRVSDAIVKMLFRDEARREGFGHSRFSILYMLLSYKITACFGIYLTRRSPAKNATHLCR